ncbi:hypothetical protein [Tsukamurella soli]|uniref:hypothetical protein n=1 Tax=Tsukamurella soli TaxID=644556 RepID=UPI00361D12C3
MSRPSPGLDRRPRVAGVLLLITATTHFSQLWALHVTSTVIGSAAFAVPYAALGEPSSPAPRGSRHVWRSSPRRSAARAG